MQVFNTSDVLWNCILPFLEIWEVIKSSRTNKCFSQGIENMTEFQTKNYENCIPLFKQILDTPRCWLNIQHLQLEAHPLDLGDESFAVTNETFPNLKRLDVWGEILGNVDFWSDELPRLQELNFDDRGHLRYKRCWKAINNDKFPMLEKILVKSSDYGEQVTGYLPSLKTLEICCTCFDFFLLKGITTELYPNLEKLCIAITYSVTSFPSSEIIECATEINTGIVALKQRFPDKKIVITKHDETGLEFSLETFRLANSILHTKLAN